MRQLFAFAFASFLACTSAEPSSKVVSTDASTEVGELDGAYFRIDMPAQWNGQLILFCHGYDDAVRPYDPRQANAIANVYVPEGIAVAQSSYSAQGYALGEAARDTENLRRHFAARFGAPRETWLMGDSLGGIITSKILEAQPQPYRGGIAFCAPLGASLALLKTIAFDALVLFEFWFPGVLPAPGAVPSGYAMSEERQAQLAHALASNPAAAAALRARCTARTNAELAELLDLFTHIMGDLRRRWGGNPLDNRDTVYQGLGDDLAINTGVKRYTADLAAERQAIDQFTPSGRLSKPLLSVRTVYDPLLGAFGSDRYADIVRLAGHGQWFAQTFVPGEGHCAISASERRTALQVLRRWAETGGRPGPGLLHP